MSKTETGNVEIRLNTDQAIAQLKKTEKEIEKLEKSLDKLGTGDPEKRKQLYEQLQTAKSEALKLRDSIKTEMRVIINGEVAGKNLRELESALAIAKREYKSFADEGNSEGTKKLAQGIAKIEAQIKLLEQPLKDARKELIDLGADNSLSALRNKASLLRSEIEKLSPGTAQFVAKTKELQSVDKEVDNINKTLSGQTGLWQNLSSHVKQFGVLAAGYLGLQALSSSVSNIIQKNSELADSNTGVMQTTGMTAQEVDKLNQAFKKLDTRTSTSDLREIAKVGGQFGVAKEDILSFTDAINKATVVLKSEFSGGAEEITTVLSGLRNVLSDTKTNDISQDLTHLGNALVVLAQQGNATAPVLSEFANRIGGVGVPLGLSSGQILGLSATMQELSINAERGGTAVGKILQKMTTNTAEFAKIAGVPLQDFQRMVNEDIMGAFQKFLEGTKRFKGDALAMGGALKDLETSGGGVSEVLAKLGGNTGLLTEKVKTASDSLKETNAITDQYNLSNNNLAGQIDRLNKKLYAFATNQTFKEWVLAAAQGLNNFLDTLQNLPQFIQRNSTLLISLAGATALFFANTIKATLATAANTAATLLNNAAYEIGFARMVVMEQATKAYAFAKGVLTGQITLATAAQRIFNLVLSLNPIGLVIAALTAAGAAFAYYLNNTKEAIELEKAKYDISKQLAFAVNDLTKANEEYSKAIDKLNTLAPQQQKDLMEEIRLKRESAIATLEKIKAEQTEIGQKSNNPSFLQTMANAVTSAFTGTSGAADFAIKQTVDGANNAKEAMAEYDDKIKEVDDQIKKLSSSMDKVGNILNAESNAMKINVQTTTQYEEKLSLLNIALKNAIKDGADYKRILSEINATKAAFKLADSDSNTTKLKLDSSSAEASAANFQLKLQKIIDDIGKAQTDAIVDAAQRESEQLAASYIKAREAALNNETALIDQQKRFLEKKLISKSEFDKRESEVHNQTNTLLLALEDKYQIERQQLAKKYSDKIREEEYQADITNLAQWRAANILATSQLYADGKISKKEYEDQKAQIELQVLQLRLQYAKDYGREVTKEEQAIVDEKIRIAEQEAAKQQALAKQRDEIISRNKQAALAHDILLQLAALQEQENAELALFQNNEEEQSRIKQYYTNERIKLIQKELQAFVSFAQQAFSSVSSIMQSQNQKQTNIENAQLQHEQNILNKKKEMLKQSLDQKQITQEQYNAKIAALDNDFNKKQGELKLKQWKRDKETAIKTATIDALLAIANALATVSWPYNLVIAALVGAAAYAKVDAIKSESPPQFKQGRPAGEYIQPGKGGMAIGPSHDRGGIDMIDTSTGKTVGNMEGNEMIVGVKAVENNPELAQLLLDSSRQGGAKIQPHTLQNLVFLDSPDIIHDQAQKALHFAAGREALTDSLSQKLLDNISPKYPLNDITAKFNSILSTTADYIDKFITTYTGSAIEYTQRSISAFINTSASSPIPQINTSRMIDNIRINQIGYAAAQQYSSEMKPVSLTTDDAPKNKDMMEMMEQMKILVQQTNNTLQLTHESLKNPIHVKTQFVFKDYDEQRRIEQQAKRNARIG